jgi:hypothetical protein
VRAYGGGRGSGLPLPERNQDVNQGDDGQPQMADSQADSGQQIVGFGVAWQPDAENGGKQEHGSALTIAFCLQ